MHLLCSGYLVIPGSQAAEALTTYPHLAPKLKSRTLHLLHLCAFMLGYRVNSIYLLQVKCYIWNMALCGAGAWTLRKVDQKYQGSSAVWCCRRMETSWADRVRNEVSHGRPRGQEYTACSEMREDWLDWLHLGWKLPCKTRYWWKVERESD